VVDLSRYCQCPVCVKAAKAGIWQDVESSAPSGHTRKWRWPMEWTSRKERNQVMGVEVVEDPYQSTPKWHPFYWIGWKLRRRIHAEPWDGSWWEYANPKKAARNVLEERYGG
jgi:hypothetical protein